MGQPRAHPAEIIDHTGTPNEGSKPMTPQDREHSPADEIDLEELSHADDRPVFLDDADDCEWTA
ncbi:hypothetical protein [Spirillospora sp. CA-294931]|uniref:hypothetical protein n=1 Tax=Spirillospora sp. CA-294931 TaxID=3240042 RepID=UPI003D948554